MSLVPAARQSCSLSIHVLIARVRFGTAIQKERKLAEPSLVRACRLTFGWEFLRLGWLKAANTGLGFAGPLLLKVVVDAVQDASKPEGVLK